MKLLVSEPEDFSKVAVDRLRKAGHTVGLVKHDRRSISSVIDRYDGLIVRLGILLDEDLLRRASKLEVIATPTTGLDHVDIGYCEINGIKVLSLRGANGILKQITSTAELAVGLMLNLYRHLPAASEAGASGDWDRSKFVGRELAGKTIGIIGMGRLGGMVAKISEAFGARIIYYDPEVDTKLFEKKNSLGALARIADIVTVHVHLNNKSVGMIGRDFFNKCEKKPLFINTSRGELVDEKELLRALRRGVVLGAGLDVLSGELLGVKKSNDLLRYAREHDNLVITPHIGGATYDAMRATEEFIVDKLIEYGAKKS